MHFYLRGKEREGGFGRGDGERVGDQFEWHQIRDALELSLIQTRGACFFHDHEETGGAKQDEEDCNIWDTSSFLPCFLRGGFRGFSKRFTPSSLFPADDVNSRAAEVISFLFDS